MSSKQSTEDRDYDVIVWGASGFTGRLVVEYLADRYPPGGDVKWAVGGRSKDKLDEVLEGIIFSADRPDVIVAESHDQGSMQRLASSARVILTTVGPYAKYGSELLEACAAAGTDYCDLCGEVQWMRKMIDQHQSTAEKSGARKIGRAHV